jgi:hypothetical protein
LSAAAASKKNAVVSAALVSVRRQPTTTYLSCRLALLLRVFLHRRHTVFRCRLLRRSLDRFRQSVSRRQPHSNPLAVRLILAASVFSGAEVPFLTAVMSAPSVGDSRRDWPSACSPHPQNFPRGDKQRQLAAATSRQHGWQVSSSPFVCLLCALSWKKTRLGRATNWRRRNEILFLCGSIGPKRLHSEDTFHPLGTNLVHKGRTGRAQRPKSTFCSPFHRCSST